MISRGDKISDLKRQLNTEKLKNKVLEDAIKSKLFKAFMEKFEESEKFNSAKKENEKLREKIKVYQELLRGEKNEPKRKH